MDAGSVTDLYQRYKIGTSHVVQGLANTARQTCDLASIVPSIQTTTLPKNPTEPPGTKKKQRAKVQPITLNATLSIQDLATLAHSIGSTATAAKAAPEGIDTTIKVLQDVIKDRSDFILWYRSRIQTINDDANEGESGRRTEDDKRHCHFVDDLKDILETQGFGAVEPHAWRLPQGP